MEQFQSIYYIHTVKKKKENDEEGKDGGSIVER